MNYVERLMEIACTKKTGWQDSDCPVVRTSTIETTKGWKVALGFTKETEEKLYTKCVLAIEAQARFRREERLTAQNGRGKYPVQPKMLSSWLRNGRWEEMIGSHSDLKEKIAATKCKCGRNVIGPGFDKCDNCEPFENGKLTGLLTNEMRTFYQAHPETHTMTHIEVMRWTEKTTGKICKKH